jgi:hypothetical protein
MIDMDPGLDTKLRAFFEHIEASSPPSGLTDFDVAAGDRRRRSMFNVFAGLAGAAVVAAGVAVFAIQLRSHDSPPPAPAESSQRLPRFKVHGDTRVLVPVTYGRGSVTLPAFTLAPGESVYVQVACKSGTTADTVQVGQNQRFGSAIAGCSTPTGGHGGWFGTDQGGPSGGSVTTYVTADPAVSWEILMTDGPPPILAPPGSRALRPVAYGRGSGRVPEFTAAKDYFIAIDCSGAGSLTIVSSLSQAATILCAQYAQFYFTPSEQVPGKPVSLSVVAPSGVGWEVEVFEDGGPSPGACATLRDQGGLKPTPCAASSS